MVAVKTITVEVAYAKPDHQKVILVEIKEGSTLEQVIKASGILTLYPEIDLSKQKIGIFGKIKNLQDIIQVGDRIEIYRPLLIDPKEARRKRAKNRHKLT